MTPRRRLHSADIPRHRFGAMPLSRIGLMAMLAGSVLLQMGCMQRRMLIRSNPEGALITVDNVPVGHTPVAVPFTYYGTREIRAEMDGFQSQKIKHRFRAPWYQIPPLDLITDNFWPREIHDDRVLDLQMLPAELADGNLLLDRGNQLRSNSQFGTVPMPLAHEKIEPTIDTPPQQTAELPSVLDRFR